MEKRYEDIEESFWDYKEIEGVSGIYHAMNEDVGKNKSKVYLLKQEDGSIVNVWGSIVLDNQMKKVSVGDDIRIVYLGEKQGEGKGKRPYHDFKIQKAKLQTEENREGGDANGQDNC